MGRPPKKKDHRYWRKRSVTLAKKIARHEANYTCAYCKKREPNIRTHGSHIYAEGKNPNMSADVDNIMCLCASHHAIIPGRTPGSWNWHAYPGESWEWFMENYPELHQELRARSQKIYKVNWEKKFLELKEHSKSIGL